MWIPSPPTKPKRRRAARPAPVIQRKTVAQIRDEAEREQKKRMAAAMMPLVVQNMGNAKANIEMALRGLSGAQVDLSGAVTASGDAGIEFPDALPAAVVRLNQINAMIGEVSALIETGETEIMETEGFADYHRSTWGCEPTGVMQG